jgi:hypothetical protein
VVVPWWIHPTLAAALLTLTATTVYFGRKSAKMPVDTYLPTAKLHITLATATIATACVVVLLGPYVVNESGLPALASLHAAVGVTAVSLWIVQGLLGWRLWNDKENIRKVHRYNGFFVLGLAMLQVPFGLGVAVEYLEYYGFP